MRYCARRRPRGNKHRYPRRWREQYQDNLLIRCLPPAGMAGAFRAASEFMATPEGPNFYRKYAKNGGVANGAL